MIGTLCVLESPEPGVESVCELSLGIEDHLRLSVFLKDAKSLLVVSPFTFFFFSSRMNAVSRIAHSVEAKGEAGYGCHKSDPLVLDVDLL